MPRTFTYTTEVFDEYTDFPQTGDVDTIYIDASKNKAYRYDQSYYPISSEGVDIWGAIGSLSKGGGGGGGGASWGSINGTLSNQTDLNTALSAKQDTLTLTTTGTSGAATLVDSTLNIPQYGGGASNPSVIALTATNGTDVTGTIIQTISQSLLIPANTFTTDGNLEVLGRILKTGASGNQTFRIYKNTTSSLTGATLIGLILSNSNSIYCQGIRTYRINSNTLTGFPSVAAAGTDYAGNANTETSTTFNTSVDNYIIFAIQLTSILDSSVVRMSRATKYI
jgi:hypothetical protein